MSNGIKHGFQKELVKLAIVDLIPSKALPVQTKVGQKYSQIISSIREVGLIEPPVVSKLPQEKGYLLLDGHLRIMALKELGEMQVSCLVSTDDEAYTYNKYVNKLSAIQEHRMIIKALKSGVSETKLASALNLELRSLRHKKTLLNGVCPEAVDLLKDKIVSREVFGVLKKMKPIRQIAVANLMNDRGRYSYAFAKTLLDGSPADQLVKGAKFKTFSQAALDKSMRLQEESLSLTDDIEMIKESYGKDVLNLTVVLKYLERIMANDKVADYLEKYHPAIFSIFSEVLAINFLKMKNIDAFQEEN